MTIQTFIEKAIEGGWKPTYHGSIAYVRGPVNEEKMWLDPEAWKAVGKVEGWCDSNVGVNGACVDCGFKTRGSEWLVRWHDMIDAIAEGKTLESFMETL